MDLTIRMLTANDGLGQETCPRLPRFLDLERCRFSKIATSAFECTLLKPLDSFIGRFVACSAQISVDRQTNRHTHTQNDYRCARADNSGMFRVFYILREFLPRTSPTMHENIIKYTLNTHPSAETLLFQMCAHGNEPCSHTSFMLTIPMLLAFWKLMRPMVKERCTSGGILEHFFYWFSGSVVILFSDSVVL